jgi:hypothetical protein
MLRLDFRGAEWTVDNLLNSPVWFMASFPSLNAMKFFQEGGLVTKYRSIELISIRCNKLLDASLKTEAVMAGTRMPRSLKISFLNFCIKVLGR